MIAGMKKTCTKCGKSKDYIEGFSLRNRSTGRRQSWCKSCATSIRMTYYWKNPAYTRDRTKKGRAEKVDKYIEFLKRNPCVDCHEDDIRVLDLDHVRGKKIDSVPRMIHRGFSWSRIQEEIEKCEVRCSNCHRRKTASEQGWKKHILGA